MPALRNAPLRKALLTVTVALVSIGLVGVGACRPRNERGAWTPPSGAGEWSPEHAELYDDGVSLAPVRFEGRAPNDVLDQTLFQRRLGHADVVALVRVEQIWGRGRYQGQATQYLDVALGEILLGELPRGAADRQELRVESAVDLPGSLPGKVLILFLRWAPEQDPAFHHHLSMARRDAIELVEATVDHARAEGAIGRDGRQRRRKRRKSEEALN